MQKKSQRSKAHLAAKRVKGQKFSQQNSPNTLLPTDEIITLAQKVGVDFGTGNANERIRYFIKLGILPHAVRKSTVKVASQSNSSLSTLTPNSIVGHLPYSALQTLINVERLKKNGLSFPQIAGRLKDQKVKESASLQGPVTQTKRVIKSEPIARVPSDTRYTNKTGPRKNQVPSGTWPTIHLFSRSGISEKDFAKKLKVHEENFAKILENKLSKFTPPQVDLEAFFAKKQKSVNVFFKIGKNLLITLTLTGLVGAGIYSTRNYLNNIKDQQNISEDIQESSNLIGQVLAATSDQHRLYIDADTQVSGTTLFAENITAPNVLYGAIGGTGITVSSGQTPTIALDDTAVVRSVNAASGVLTIKGSGSAKVSTSGSTITVDSSAITSEADTLSTVTGRGATTSTALTLNGAVTLGSTLSLSTTDSTVNITNTGSLAFKDGTNTLFSLVDQGSFATVRLSDKGSTNDPLTCSTGEIYFNATDASVKACTVTNIWEALDASGATSAWDALTNPSGNLSLSHGANTTTMTTAAATQTFWTMTGTSFTTGEILDITGTWAPTDGSTNEAIDINITHTPTTSADVFTALDLNVTEGANALANTLYGLRVTTDNSANTSTGTHSIYGGYFTATGKTAGITTTYGIYATATGADTNYGIYVAAGSVNIQGLTASRFLTTDASSNLATTGASSALSSTLSDETGTGVAVFGTSPEITTSITTGSTTFALVNTTATTVNFAGAATTLSIGASTGTSTINNALAVTGNTTLTGTLTANGAATFNTDVDFTLAGSENVTLTNSSASVDQLSISATGVTTNNVDAVTATIGTATGAGANNSAFHAIINNAPVDASDVLSGLEVTGIAQTVASTTQNLIFLDPAASGNTAGNLYGLNIDSLTGNTATEYAITVGSGWDSVLRVNGTEVINGSGNVISTQVSGTLFTLDGDDVDTEAIVQGETLLIAGGTNGIDTDVSASNTITLNFDSTEIGTTTWNAGASDPVWTFNTSGATDPTLTFANNQITIASAATITATDVTTFNCTDCLDFDDFDDTLDIDAATSINTTATTTTPLTYNANSLTTGTALLFSADALTTGRILDLDQASTFTANTTVSGSQVVLTRSITQNAAATTTTVSGDMLSITSSATETAGDVSDTSNLLSLAQNCGTNVSCTGAVLDITNAGTGSGILLTSSSTGDLATLNASGSGTTANGLLIQQTGAGTITDAIDTSDETITNALNVGANTITGAGYTITSTASGLTINSTSAALALQTTTSGDITATTAAATGLFNILTGNLKVGNGTPGVTQDGEDAYIEGTLEVDGATTLDGTLTANGTSTFNTDVDFTFASAEDFTITNTTWTPASAIGLVDINTTSATNDARGIDNFFDVNSTAGRTQYGLYGNFDATSLALDADVTSNYYGIYQTITKSGVDTAAVTASTTNTFGIVGVSTNSSTTITNITRNTYGGYFSAIGAGDGVTTAYGIYATAASADTNWAGYFSGNVLTTGTFTTNDDITISNTTPSLFLTDTTASAKDWSVNVDADTFSIRNETDARNDISISGAGAVTIDGASAGEGTATLTITSGDITITNGDLNISSGEFILTSDNTVVGNAFSVTANSAQTVNVAAFLSTSLTTGELFDLNATHSPASGTNESIDINITHSPSGIDTFTSVDLVTTNSTAIASTLTGISSTITLTGNAAKTASAYYGTVTSTSTTADTLYGTDILVDHNAAAASGNKTLYGLRSQVTNDGITDASTGTHNLYGGYFSVTGNTGDTQNAFGIYVGNGTADNNYALYVADQTGGGTADYGLYIAGADNFAIYTAADDVQFTLAAADSVTIDGSTTPNTQTGAGTGVLDINVTSLTNQNSGVNLTYTSTADASSAVTQYGIYGSLSNATASGATANGLNLYGLYGIATKSTADNASYAGTQSLIGVLGRASTTSNEGASSTRNTYGGYFSAAGGGTTGTQNAYAIYASAAQGFDSLDTSYGIYVTASNAVTDYALYSAAGIVSFTMPQSDENLIINSTVDTTMTTGFVDINARSGTHQHSGINLSYTSSADGVAAATITQYGTFSSFTNTQAVTATSPVFNLYGAYGNIAKSGADNLTTGGTFNVYGTYVTANNTSTDVGAAGTRNTYGGYFSATGAGAGTTTAYGIYATAASADTNYGIYSTGANTINFFEATASTLATSGVVDLNVTSSTSGNRGLDISYTSTQAGATSQYGFYGSYTNAQVVSTSVTQNHYGAYFTTSKSGDDTATLHTVNVFGINSTASLTQAAGAGTGTRNIYGGYFSATGDTEGTQTAYGIYTKASGGDTNYSLYAAGSLPYSLYIDTTLTTTALGNSAILTNGTITVDGTESYYAYWYSSTLNIDADPTAFGSSLTFRSSETYVIDSALINFSPAAVSFYSAPTARVTGVDLGEHTFGALEGLRTAFVVSNTGSGAIDPTILTVTNVRGTYVTGTTIESKTTVANLYGLQVDNTTPTGTPIGTLTRQYGVYIANLTGGGSDYGIYVAGADTYGLWIDSGTVRMDGLVNVGLGGTASTTAVCSSLAGATAPTSGTAYELRDCSGTPAADYMEMYAVKTDVDKGEIVSPSNEFITTNDGETVSKLTKSTNSYQKDIIGIVSDKNKAGDFNSIGYNIKEEDNPQPVALSGRVPVKVSTVNGEIKAGDVITSSDIPGVGMKATKAGRTIGVALESFNCSTNDQGLTQGESQALDVSLSTLDESCTGKIVVFVEPSWYLGSALASNGSIIMENVGLDSQKETQEVRLADLTVDQFGVLVDQGYLDGQILTAEQVQKLVEREVDKQLQSFLATSYQPSVPSNQIASPLPEQGYTPGVQDPNTPGVGPSEATDSADLAQQTQQTLSELDQLLVTTDLSLNSLTVTGNTNLAQTQVAGTFSQDGTLIIDYGKQINVLGSTLYLQNDAFAGDLSAVLLDIGGGKVTVDKQGNLVIAGTLVAKNIETKELTVNVSDATSQTVGSSSIDPGSSQKTVFTTAIKPNAKILVTPTTPTGGKTIYISTKVDFEGFTVAIENGPAASPINFDWLIVNTTQVSKALQ